MHQNAVLCGNRLSTYAARLDEDQTIQNTQYMIDQPSFLPTRDELIRNNLEIITIFEFYRQYHCGKDRRKFNAVLLLFKYLYKLVLR